MVIKERSSYQIWQEASALELRSFLTNGSFNKVTLLNKLIELAGQVGEEVSRDKLFEGQDGSYLRFFDELADGGQSVLATTRDSDGLDDMGYRQAHLQLELKSGNALTITIFFHKDSENGVKSVNIAHMERRKEKVNK